MNAYKFCRLSDIKKEKHIGEVIKTDYFGDGVVAKTDDGRVMVKIVKKCKTNQHEIEFYLTDAFTTGDLGNVYDKSGKFQGNIGNSSFLSFCECK